LRVRARPMGESEIACFLSKIAQNDVKIIYFHETGGFLSGFGKLNCFSYIGEECSTFQNCILRRIKHAF
jgi:hypothetical protein